MRGDILNFAMPSKDSSIIKVIGVGGGGSNAVNYMYKQGIADVSFVVCNTDAQALNNSPVPEKIHLGATLSQGRGAGNRPEVGKQSAIESLEEITQVLDDNTKMVFITAGMGGGTGTGAAPVIAKVAKEMGILTVGIVTIPFKFEGGVRIKQAIEGIAEMEKYVDSLLIINNELLKEMYGDLKISNAFAKADDVLTVAAKGIAEIITVHGYINVDFADVETVMKDSGVAVMGSGVGTGEYRAIDAIQAALESPLLNSNNVQGAKNILLNITSGVDEITMDEVSTITGHLEGVIGNSATIIWGTGIQERLTDEVVVTIIATGFATDNFSDMENTEKKEPTQVYRMDTEGNVHIEQEFEVETKRDEPVRFDYRGNRANTISDNTIEKIDKLYGESPIKRNQEKPIEDKNVSPTVNYEHSFNRQVDIEDLSDEEFLKKIENEPAYKRRNRSLGQEESSDINYGQISRFSISKNDDDIEFDGRNSFLYDNVD